MNIESRIDVMVVAISKDVMDVMLTELVTQKKDFSTSGIKY